MSPSHTTVRDLDKLQEIIGYTFKDPAYLANALVHSSAKKTDSPSNERLEFLGDAVLGLVMSDFLYETFPEADEGELTAIKSVVVSAITLAEEVKKRHIDEYILIGRGVKGRRGEVPRSLLGDVFEAIVAAVYLDGGLENARNLILGTLRDHVAGIVKEGVGKRNYKAILQHYAQTEFACQPEYTVLRQFGPLHDRSFEVIAKLVGRRFGKGIGKTKKDAEQSAARVTLLALKVECDRKLT